MTSDSPFPPIGQLTYLLTFPPYGFLWFVLAEHGREPSWRQPHAEPLPEYVTLVMRRGDTRPNVEQLHVLAHDALPSWLARRRWFASKDRAIGTARLNVVTPVPGEPFQYAEAWVESGATGDVERYVVPLAAAWGGETSQPLFTQLALARVRRGHSVGYLTDAFALPAFAHGMLRKLRDGATVPTTDGGRLAFLPEDALAALDPGDDAEVRWLAAEQSNSSLVIGDAIVLKLVRKVAHGVHPEAEMSRYLTRIGYPNTATLAGEVVHVDPDGTPHTVAILQRYVDKGDAWTRSFDFLRRAVDDCRRLTKSTPTTPTRNPTRCSAMRRSRGSSARGASCTSRSRSRPTIPRSRRSMQRPNTSTAGARTRSRRSSTRSTCCTRGSMRSTPRCARRPTRCSRHATRPCARSASSCRARSMRSACGFTAISTWRCSTCRATRC